MIEVFFNNERISPFQSLQLPKIKVDRAKDIDPDKPIPTVFEVRIENSSKNHLLKDIKIDTNLPRDTYDIAGLPEIVSEDSIEKFRLYFYAKRAIDSKEFPSSVYFNIVGNELLKTQ